jgi:CheY-like chemotaxis protein
MNAVLIHWNADERASRLVRLERFCRTVTSWTPEGASPMRALEALAPDVVVIDLSRLPARGRDLAIAIRQRRLLRAVPIVFVDGDAEKVSAIRELLPDAVYTTWRQVGEAVRRAGRAPVEGVAPPLFAPYAGRSLASKLGIRQAMTVALVNAHDDLAESLDDLPDGVRFVHEPDVPCALSLWWVRTRAELEATAPRIAEQARFGPVWIIYPKKGGPMGADLTQGVIRLAANAVDMVDYRICAVDETWSGMLLRRRS